jgi:predicted AlkP superfamily phosphohydrolase/phosphomutase/tetratricopeptide (TPR) repeat protein
LRCVAEKIRPRSKPVASRRKVLLIGWDAADWKVIHPLMDAGKMPNLQRLVESGAAGPIATLHPPLSPMLWTSIATGKRPFQHGIHGFSEPTPNGLGVQPVTNLSRKCKAIWNILTQNDIESTVIGWWPSHPAEPIHGVMVSDHYHRARGPIDKPWPLLPGCVHPPELADTLADLRMHPDLLIPDMVEPFIPLAREIDQDKDKRLAGMMRTLCECVSIHSAATWLIDNRPWDFFAVYYDAIDHFCHGYMKYHPPKQAWVTDRDFELYGNVVSMAYQFHDRMLGTLLHKARTKAGDDVNVILMSDHGFHPDHLRPKSIPDIPAGPAIEHREFGILAMSGPGIRKDELLHGASVLDVTPTILTLFGLPVGEDMAGKVLAAAFEEPPAEHRIPSWEDVPAGDGKTDGRHPPHTQLDPLSAHEAMEQMIALGYIQRPDEDAGKAVANTVRELRYNLGEAYQDDHRHLEAHEIFTDLYAADPDEQRYAVHLFVSAQALGRIEEMRRIVDGLDGRRRALYEEAVDRVKAFRKLAAERAAERKDVPVPEEVKEDPDPDKKHEPLLSAEERAEFAKWRNLARFQPPVIDYLKAQVLTGEQRYGEALEALERVKEAHLARPGLFLQTAELYGKLHRWREAEQVYEKALDIDPDNAHAYAGKSRMALRRRRYEEAVQYALDAVQRLYHNPMGHFLLGVGLAGMKDYERAAEALRVALSLNPNFPEAHRRLALLLSNRLNDPEGAKVHRRLYRETRANAGGPRRPEEKRQATITAPVANSGEMPPLEESVVVVSGLPRSGTSMIMQMLAAGGMPVLTDNLREADADNPRGYLEYEPVKNLQRESGWIAGAQGKAVKIVAPLLTSLPPGHAYRVILIERDFNEILNSQAQMLLRRNENLPDTLERRERLKDAYAQTLLRAKTFLGNRPHTRLLVLQRNEVLADPAGAASQIEAFLEAPLGVSQMAAEVDPALHRQRG